MKKTLSLFILISFILMTAHAGDGPPSWKVNGKVIVKGMTQETVKKLLGKPMSSGDSMKESESTIWIYQGKHLANDAEGAGIGVVSSVIPFGGGIFGNSAANMKSESVNFDVIFGDDGNVLRVSELSNK